MTTDSYTNQKRAIAKYVRISPSKVRRVANLVRRKPVDVAVGILSNMPHKGALLLLKVIKSAYSNVNSHYPTTPNECVVDQIMINEAPVMKRYQTRAKGRMNQILKRSAHIEVIVKQGVKH